MNKLGKYCKKHFGKHVSRVLPVCIANLLVFFLVGVWHGPAWKFIVYGLYNGIIIAASNPIGPHLRANGPKLHIPAESRPWTAVRIIRTFLLVNISWYFDMAESLGAALAMMKNTVAGFIPVRPNGRQPSEAGPGSQGLCRPGPFLRWSCSQSAFSGKPCQHTGCPGCKAPGRQMVRLSDAALFHTATGPDYHDRRRFYICPILTKKTAVFTNGSHSG